MPPKPAWKPANGIKPQPCPGPDERPFVRVASAPIYRELRAVLLNNTVQGFTTHWINGQTEVCMHSGTFCRGCRENMGKRWDGYVGGLLLPNRSIWIVKIPAAGFRNSPSLLRLDGTLRGRTITLRRLQAKKNGPVQAIVADSMFEGPTLPTFDLYGALGRLWGVDLAHLNKHGKDFQTGLPAEEEEPTELPD